MYQHWHSSLMCQQNYNSQLTWRRCVQVRGVRQNDGSGLMVMWPAAWITHSNWDPVLYSCQMKWINRTLVTCLSGDTTQTSPVCVYACLHALCLLPAWHHPHPSPCYLLTTVCNVYSLGHMMVTHTPSNAVCVCICVVQSNMLCRFFSLVDQKQGGKLIVSSSI